MQFSSLDSTKILARGWNQRECVCWIVEDTEEDVLEASDARELTRQIRVALEHSYTLIIAAYRGRAWSPMGYSSWDAYCQGEFGNLALQPPREERQNVIMSMREAGMSIRAISSGTGIGRGTVERELSEAAPTFSGVSNGTPENESELPRVIGTDGKNLSPNCTSASSTPCADVV
ncbi:hypothetical protein GU243_23245 [Pseudarthrobacter psychrotolerans]|uniref:Uncharacterized protein n=1 Tax=Pseudarthrobacter psychrotolerans TaxID=2697569 RepID=A0A6P1NU63_9MICC|nr:hypothetical protein [Pseudarthrobacter psychrotolerans]QHK22094.1 hypothetical protein GU243_23245 [Pseudarthrobacter psychrotolerans]